MKTVELVKEYVRMYVYKKHNVQGSFVEDRRYSKWIEEGYSLYRPTKLYEIKDSARRDEVENELGSDCTFTHYHARRYVFRNTDIEEITEYNKREREALARKNQKESTEKLIESFLAPSIDAMLKELTSGESRNFAERRGTTNIYVCADVLSDWLKEAIYNHLGNKLEELGLELDPRSDWFTSSTALVKVYKITKVNMD